MCRCKLMAALAMIFAFAGAPPANSQQTQASHPNTTAVPAPPPSDANSKQHKNQPPENHGPAQTQPQASGTQAETEEQIRKYEQSQRILMQDIEIARPRFSIVTESSILSHRSR